MLTEWEGGGGEIRENRQKYVNGTVSTFNTMQAVDVSLYKLRMKNTKHYHQIVKQ
jgi:hypothetical protein